MRKRGGVLLGQHDNGLLELSAVIEVGAAGELPSVDAHQANLERARARCGCLDIPVLGIHERHALALPLDDHARGGGLHPAG